MPTVIDSLIIELGLDPKKFTQGQKDAVAAFKRTKDAATKDAGDIEAAGARAASFFNKLKTEAIGFFAVLIGGVGMAEFIQKTVTLDADLGRLAKNLGVAIEDLSAFRGAVMGVGGGADDAAASLQSIVNTAEKIRFGLDPGNVQVLQTLGVTLQMLQDPMATMLHLADRFSKMTPADAQMLGGMLGLTPSTINLLEKGRQAVIAALEAEKRAGVVHKEDADAAAEAQRNVQLLNQTYSRLGNDLLNDVLPALVGFGKWLTRVGQSPEMKTLITDLGKLFKVLGSLYADLAGGWQRLGLPPIFPTLLKWIDAIIREIEHLARAMDDVAHGKWGDAAKEAGRALVESPVGRVLQWGYDAVTGKHPAPPARAPASQSAPSESGSSPSSPSTSASDASGAPSSSAPASGGPSSPSALTSSPRAPGAAGNGSLADRNNNPGNIMHGGQYDHYASMAAGYAAMARQIMSDIYRHGQDTIRKLINDPHHGWANEWSPHNSHAATQNYMAYVARALGIGIDDHLPTNTGSLGKLIAAMNSFERGGAPSAARTAAAAQAAAMARPPGVDYANAGSMGPTRSTHIQIGALHVHTAATDAKGIARSLPAAIVAQADFGLF